MKNFKLKSSLFLTILSTGLILTSCSKSDSSPTPETPPVVIVPPTPIVISTSIFSGISGTSGSINGEIATATFSEPYGICSDASGNLYVTEKSSSKIRKITSAGIVSTFISDLNNISIPSGICIDPQSNLFVADSDYNVITKVTTSPVTSIFAGFFNYNGYNDGTGGNAEFSNPSGVCIDNIGNLFVADTDNNCIRKITPARVVSTFAGTQSFGFVNGTGANASFNSPVSICIDSNNNLYVTDLNNHAIRKITPARVVTTLAGSGVPGFLNATGSAAKFFNPAGICVNSDGTIFVADRSNKKIRQISPDGVVTTVLTSTTFSGINGIVMVNNKLFITNPTSHVIHSIQL